MVGNASRADEGDDVGTEHRGDCLGRQARQLQPVLGHQQHRRPLGGDRRDRLGNGREPLDLRHAAEHEHAQRVRRNAQGGPRLPLILRGSVDAQ